MMTLSRAISLFGSKPAGQPSAKVFWAWHCCLFCSPLRSTLRIHKRALRVRALPAYRTQTCPKLLRSVYESPNTWMSPIPPKVLPSILQRGKEGLA